MQKQTHTIKSSHLEELEAPEGKERRPFGEPKPNFVEPELVKQGDLSDVTAGFWGDWGPRYP